MTPSLRTISLFFSILLAGLLLASCGPGQHELRIIAPFALVERPIVEDLAELLEDAGVASLSIVGTAESDEAALDAVESGAVDLALISNTLPFRDNIATVMPLYPTVLHIVYREDLDASSGVTLLTGARVFAGPDGSASQIILERLVKRLGLAPGSYEYVTDIGDLPDVIIVFAPISPEIMADYPDYRLLSLVSPDALHGGSIVDAAVLLNPHFRDFVVPEGTYGVTTPEPVVTIAVDKLLVSRIDLDKTVVYDLINDILRLRPALASRRPGLFKELTEDFEVSHSRFLLHAGTQDYLQRDVPTYMERYSGVAEVVVTLLVSLISLSFAGYRIMRMRRKNRIDTFYSRAREIRDSATDSATAQNIRQAVDAIRALQAEAFDLLIDEKLSADESFRIFITLSNDILQQLGALNDARS